MSDLKLVRVYETRDQGDIAFIKSLFLAYNIKYFIAGEDFSTFSSKVLATKIMVAENDFKKAEELLKEFKAGKS